LAKPWLFPRVLIFAHRRVPTLVFANNSHTSAPTWHWADFYKIRRRISSRKIIATTGNPSRCAIFAAR
jgi:hypothetical protein